MKARGDALRACPGLLYIAPLALRSDFEAMLLDYVIENIGYCATSVLSDVASSSRVRLRDGLNALPSSETKRRCKATAT